MTLLYKRAVIAIICLMIIFILTSHLTGSTSLYHQESLPNRFVTTRPGKTGSAGRMYISKTFNSDNQNDDFDYRNQTIPVNFNIKVWNSDFHISPTADCKWIFQHFSVDIVDKSLSGHCHLMHSCQTDLRIINTENGINLNPCPNTLRKLFYESYIKDSAMNSIDMFLCTHAASMCEIFMPFDKPMVIIASTRYEIGRHQVHRWKEWNQNLEQIALKPYNVIAANNLYDLVSQYDSPYQC